MDFLKTGLALVENGYRIIPIHGGKKGPVLPDWQKTKATVGLVRRWASGNYSDGNIGILTSATPAVDLDIYDVSMAEEMEAWCLENLGTAPVRVGRAPKRLLVYRTDTPFKKMMAEFFDPRGTKHKVEILGDGQQFVAYGIHPDTQQPFTWTSLDEPTDTDVESLTLLTAEAAKSVLDRFAELAEARGWRAGQSSTGGTSMVVGQDDDDALLTYKPRLKLSADEITDALAHTDKNDDYDRWVMVGMALHHQSNGHPRALAMWHDWSASADNYDGDALDKRWKSFSEMPAGHTPVTFASVLKIANTNRKAEKSEELARLLNQVRTCNDPEEITGSLARQLHAAIENDLQRDVVVNKMQARLTEVTGVRVRVDTVRKALASHGKKNALHSAKIPTWCHGWVYLKSSDEFFNIDTKSKVSERGFNAQYDRLVLTDEDKLLGNASPATRASTLALNVYDIPAIDHTVYLPGMDSVLDMDGKKVVNLFDESSIPPAKMPETAEEKRAVKIVERHFGLLLPDATERTIFLDFLAYNVQFPAEKIVWAVLMQGAEGAGKTALLDMMAAVMGPQNVAPVTARVVMDKYTDWAEGKKVRFIEEVRSPGENRYAMIENLKDIVSNHTVTIRPMHSRSYEIPNVTNYILYTNHWDALPIKKKNRRYYVVSTYFQTEDQMAEFNARHPTYFQELYDTIANHGAVLRWWLLNRELSPVFQPKRPALDSYSKTKMYTISHGDEATDALNDILINNPHPELSTTLLNSTMLRDIMEDEGRMVPQTRGFAKMLEKAGFHLIGRHRIGGNDAVRYYTRFPQLFPRDREAEAIRECIENDGLIAPPEMPLLTLDPPEDDIFGDDGEDDIFS